MKIYLVGGAVRDGLLGLPVHERDWVVVGATAADMMAHGYTQADPDFPVFLHPQTGEEYALARRETKAGEGYRGFEIDAASDVTLEEDLRRRDLTVNAMARGSDDVLVDPYGGRDDLDAGLLRHVSPAFVEDPLRVPRIARFAAKLGAFGFRVAHGTHKLMRGMVEQGDMAHLSAERLWREMTKAMQTAQPWRFFEVLHHCGALHALIAPLARTMGDYVAAHRDADDSTPVAALKRVARQTDEPAARLAATLSTCVDSIAAADELLADLRADRKTAQLLRRAVAARDTVAAARHADAAALVELLRAWRGFDDASDIDLEIAVADAAYAQPRLEELVSLIITPVRAVSAERLRVDGISGTELGARLAGARRQAAELALREAGLLKRL